MERMHYVEAEDKLVIETVYNPTAVIEENAAIRASGAPLVVGSKGQELVLAMRLPPEHVEALKNAGYDLFSPDRDEARRAMLYVQQNQQHFLTTDKKMIAQKRQSWR